MAEVVQVLGRTAESVPLSLHSRGKSRRFNGRRYTNLEDLFVSLLVLIALVD